MVQINETNNFNVIEVTSGNTISLIITENDPRISNGQTAFDWGNHAGLYSLSNHNHSDVYEPTFIKKTGFNKDFGTTAGTVTEGNDSRVLNGQTAFDWGNHAGLYSLLNHSHSLNKTDVGLNNVDNTSDLNKPISTAAQTELNLKTKIIVKDTVVSATITGTIQTIMKSYLIPAYTFSPNDIINLQSFKIEKTGIAGTAAMRMYINTINSLTGAVQIALFTASTTHLQAKMNRTFTLRDGYLRTILTTTSAITDVVGATARTQVIFNTEVDNYIITTVTLTVGTDSVIQSELLISN